MKTSKMLVWLAMAVSSTTMVKADGYPPRENLYDGQDCKTITFNNWGSCIAVFCKNAAEAAKGGKDLIVDTASYVPVAWGAIYTMIKIVQGLRGGGNGHDVEAPPIQVNNFAPADIMSNKTALASSFLGYNGNMLTQGVYKVFDTHEQLLTYANTASIANNAAFAASTEAGDQPEGFAIPGTDITVHQVLRSNATFGMTLSSPSLGAVQTRLGRRSSVAYIRVYGWASSGGWWFNDRIPEDGLHTVIDQIVSKIRDNKYTFYCGHLRTSYNGDCAYWSYSNSLLFAVDAEYENTSYGKQCDGNTLCLFGFQVTAHQVHIGTNLALRRSPPLKRRLILATAPDPAAEDSHLVELSRRIVRKSIFRFVRQLQQRSALFQNPSQHSLDLAVASTTDTPPCATARSNAARLTFERLVTGVINAAIGIGLGLVLSYRYNIYTKQSKPEITGQEEELEQPGNTVPLKGLVYLIRNYLWATFAATIMVMLFDLGKIFSTVGALHNASEVAISLVLSRQDGFQIVQKVIFVYLIHLWFVVVILPWPYDAVYFKWQGLVFDCYVFLSFFRLYNVNMALFVSGNNTGGPLLGNNNGANEPVHKKLVWCIAAALVHFLGNVYATVDLSCFAFIVFMTCYGVAYALYGYFGWFLTLTVYTLNPSDVIKRVPTSFVSEARWFLLSMLINFSVMGVAIIAAGTSGGSVQEPLVPAPNATLAAGA
ncbi:hypothetical protein HDU96_010529 [Phlyctochytrium bullatum]|nr:hypothetical protein HDU96_010529 [Phlyctochytrium bullatum]